MDRVSKDTQKLIEDLRSAVAEARRTREQTERLLHRTAAPPTPTIDESTSTDRSTPRLRLHRTGRW